MTSDQSLLPPTADGSAIEYENAQRRILEVWQAHKLPSNFKVEMFVIRVGDWGGYMLVECDDPTPVHKVCSLLPAFTFEARKERLCMRKRDEPVCRFMLLRGPITGSNGRPAARPAAEPERRAAE